MTAPNDPTNKVGGGTDGALLGLLGLATVAGGNGGSTHARLGVYARWTCEGCTATQFTGRYPCKECCGYTPRSDKVVRGVLTAHGQPNSRCPQ